MDQTSVIKISRKEITEAIFRNIIISLIHAGVSEVIIIDGTDYTSFNYKVSKE